MTTTEDIHVITVRVNDGDYQRFKKNHPEFTEKGTGRVGKGGQIFRTYESKEFGKSLGQISGKVKTLEGQFGRVSTRIEKVNKQVRRQVGSVGYTSQNMKKAGGFFNNASSTQSTRQQRQEDLATVRSMFGGISKMPSSVISPYKGKRVPDIGSDITSKWYNSLRPVGRNKGGDLEPRTFQKFGSPEFNAAESDDLATGRTSKQTRSPWSLARGARPRSMAMASNISHKTYTTAAKPQKAVKQTESRFRALNRRLQPYNKAIFQTQMATLGVAFSFMSLQTTIMGAIQSLTDLGGNIKAAAMGEAMTGVDVLGSLGIDYKTFVDGWKAITGILSLVQTLMVGIISKALTPDIVKAITDVIAAVAIELGKPEVTKALQELVRAFLDIVKAVIPLIVPLANLVTALGESGLLKVILGIILSAGILLPLFSLIGGAFTVFSSILTFATPVIAFLTTVVGYLATALGLTGAGLGAVIAAIGIVVLLVIGTIVNAFAEFQKTGDVVKSIIFGFIDTFGAFVDAMGSMLNMLLGWTGKFNYVEGTATREFKNMAGGYSSSATVNNYNINGDVFDTASLQTAINKTKGNQGVTY